MMKIFLTLSKISAVLGLVLVLGACSDDEEKKTTVTFSFEIRIDNEPVVFDSKKYLTPSDQQVSYEFIKIYLSNVHFRDTRTNEVYSEPDSYHLVSFDATSGTASFVVEGVPIDYKVSEIEFSIGVDPEANTSIDHVGDLDPTNGMAWDWNTGYKFFSLEGRYFAENDPLGEEIKMHIGTDKNYSRRIFLFRTATEVRSTSDFYFTIDAMAPFGDIDLSEGTVFMNDERGDQIANNYRSSLIKSVDSFGL